MKKTMWIFLLAGSLLLYFFYPSEKQASHVKILDQLATHVLQANPKKEDLRVIGLAHANTNRLVDELLGGILPQVFDLEGMSFDNLGESLKDLVLDLKKQGFQPEVYLTPEEEDLVISGTTATQNLRHLDIQYAEGGQSLKWFSVELEPFDGAFQYANTKIQQFFEGAILCHSMAGEESFYQWQDSLITLVTLTEESIDLQSRQFPRDNSHVGSIILQVTPHMSCEEEHSH